MQERRRFDRVRAFQGGSIAAPRQPGAAPCVVRDVSEAGALLLVDEPGRAGADIVLRLDDGAMRHARVVWRGERSVGVDFASPAGAPRPGAVVSLDAARRARAVDPERRLAERVAWVLRPRGGGDHGGA